MYKSDLEAAHAQVEQLKQTEEELRCELEKIKRERKEKSLLNRIGERLSRPDRVMITLLIGEIAILVTMVVLMCIECNEVTEADTYEKQMKERASISLQMCKERRSNARKHSIDIEKDLHCCRYYYRAFNNADWFTAHLNIMDFEIDDYIALKAKRKKINTEVSNQ